MLKISISRYNSSSNCLSEEVPAYEKVRGWLFSYGSLMKDQAQVLNKAGKPIKHLVISGNISSDEEDGKFSDILENSIQCVSRQISFYHNATVKERFKEFALRWFPNVKKIIYKVSYTDSSSLK